MVQIPCRSGFPSGVRGGFQCAAGLAFAEDGGVLLAAGDKQGVDEKQFYRELIDLAEERFDRHLARLRQRR